MKKLLLFFSIFIYLNINAQDYTPLLADVNEWQFSTCFMGDCLKDVYFTDGDTLVNNTSYKILDGYHYISRTFLLREDVTTQQVFLLTIINGEENEYLLYNFSMNVGDEIEMLNPFSPFPSSGGMFTLTSIDNIELVDGTIYKQFNFSPSQGNTISTWNATWIEGIGSLSIVTAPGGNPNFDGVGALSCSFRNGNSFYSNFERVHSCDAVLNIVENEILSDVNIFPNPTSDCFYINSKIDDLKISIIDVMGKVVLEYKAQQCYDITSLNKGVYFVKLNSIDGTSLKKIVKN